jgi:hypothetical protein
MSLIEELIFLTFFDFLMQLVASYLFSYLSPDYYFPIFCVTILLEKMFAISGKIAEVQKSYGKLDSMLL